MYDNRSSQRTDANFRRRLLQERRLSKAKELLENSQIPITEIVEEIGYDNISYFYRIFKNKYGKTPKQFREQLER